MLDVGDDDLGQLDLEQVDLLAQQDREQEVERPGEDVELQVEVGDGHRLRVSRRADAHALAHLGERRRGDRPRLLGAGGERRLERRLVGAQLGVALADRRQQLDHALGDRVLEVAVAGALELALDLGRVDAARDGEDVDQVGDPGLVRARGRPPGPESVTALPSFLRIASGSSST